MKSPFAYLVLTLLWACIYLPALGDREIRGEEWRRTLPARTMMNTGEWIVPYSGGVPYLHKPPLINWVNAGVFMLTGKQNEWTARLPSALLMLAGALGIHAFSKRFMGGDGAFVGTVFFLTSLGCVGKGRIAEIEVYYIVFTGLAFTAWLASFLGKMNRWAAWLMAGACLGFAFLAKGPAHLLFFYLIVLGACWKAQRWRELISPPHLAGLALCFAIVLAWAIPFMQRYERLIETQPWLAPASMKGGAVEEKADTPERPKGALAIWKYEISSRVTGEEESSTKDRLVRGPRALTQFLPWVLFVPFAWKRRIVERAFGHELETARIFRGIWWGIAASFTIMVLLPSSSPRYVAPLIAPVAILIGWALVKLQASAMRGNKTWRWIAMTIAAVGVLLLGAGSFITFPPPDPVFPSGWQLAVLIIAFGTGLLGFLKMKTSHDSGTAIRNCFLTMAACAVAMTGYAWIGPWKSAQSEDIRPTAIAIRDAIQPKDSPLYIFHLGQQPYAFYLPPDTLELYHLQQLPQSGVKWMLTTKKFDADFRRLLEKSFGPARTVATWRGAWGASDQDVNRHMVLLRFGDWPVNAHPQ